MYFLEENEGNNISKQSNTLQNIQEKLKSTYSIVKNFVLSLNILKPKGEVSFSLNLNDDRTDSNKDNNTFMINLSDLDNYNEVPEDVKKNTKKFNQIRFIKTHFKIRHVILDSLSKVLTKPNDSQQVKSEIEKNGILDSLVKSLIESEEFKKYFGTTSERYDKNLYEVLKNNNYINLLTEINAGITIENIKNFNKFLKKLLDDHPDVITNFDIDTFKKTILYYLTENNNERLKIIIQKIITEAVKDKNFISKFVDKVKNDFLKLAGNDFKNLKPMDKVKRMIKIIFDAVKNPGQNKYAFGIILAVFILLVIMIMKIPFLRRLLKPIGKIITFPFRMVAKMFGKKSESKILEAYLTNPHFQRKYDMLLRKLDYYMVMYNYYSYNYV